MIHTVHDPTEPTSLDSFSTTVEATVSVRYGRTIAAADVLANWSRIEIRLTSPDYLVGITWVKDRSGFVPALAAQQDPSQRFTYEGHLTAHGIRIAQQAILQAIRDHERVRDNTQAVAERCLYVKERLQSLDSEGQRRSVTTIRSEIRRSFKEGAMTQRQFQAAMKQLRENDLQTQFDLRQVYQQLTCDVVSDLGSPPLSFDHANVHLRDEAILARLDDVVREKVAALLEAHPG